MAVSVCKSFEELTAFFHNGKVRCVIRIENIVDSDFLEGAYKLAKCCILVFQSDLLAPGGSYGRCNLHHRDDVRIRKRIV